MAQGGVISWSQTAASNATADPAVGWSEGQAPSTVNDSARALMASVAKWRDDISSIIVTGGSGTAYTIVSNQIQDGQNRNGYTIQFTPGTTNTGAVTLSVDSQAAKPLRFLTGVDLPSGVLISGSLYQATFRTASDEWLLHSFDSSIYAIPIGASVEYWGPTAPNSAFVIPTGQAISRTTYATLFTRIGTTYGVGDGSTTFNLPNPAGRVTVQKESSASLLTSTYFGGNSTALGATGGAESLTLSASQIPSISVSGTVTVYPAGNSNLYVPTANGNQWLYAPGPSSGTLYFPYQTNNSIESSANSFSASNSMTSTNTGGAAHRTVQPTIICNRIMRIA
ncbi:microcystin-dependent protein [Bradyrhizobium sp. AZCC 1719]|uniref:phage tail protein n=1 Tax=Bradyrhizobium sp. AZCC 1719 TaxID=3117028 RepID=UPI002FF29B0D